MAKSHDQDVGATELEAAWADLPKESDPRCEYLLTYYARGFAERMVNELCAWKLHPRYGAVENGAAEPAQADAWPRSCCAILRHELSVNAPLRYCSVGLYEGKWLDSDITLQVASTRDDASESFWHDAEWWFKLNHPNVVKLFGASECGGRKLFVCEPVSGKTLGDFLFPVISRQPQAVAVRCHKLFEIALGLQYLHNANIVHSDVRSSSVWLGRDFTAELNCSGIRDPRPPRRYGMRSPPHPRWGAPESLANEQPAFSTKSDVFALAKLIIQTRFPERLVLDVIAEHDDHVLRERVASCALPDLSSTFSDAQTLLLHRMCSVNPDERPSIAEVEEQLRATDFGMPLCEVAATMRAAHDRNVFYGLLPSLSAVVRPDCEWVSPLSEAEAAESFRVGLAVLDGLAPELATGGTASQASDVFGLGMLIAKMVPGQSWRDLYPCPTPACVVGSWMRSNIIPPKPAAFTEAEWGLVKRMCAFDPSARVSISTVVAEIGKFVNDAMGIEEDAELQWDPDHIELPGNGITVTDALTVANELLGPQGPDDAGTDGTRWILLRLEYIDRLLKSATQPPYQIPLSIIRTYADTLASLLKLLEEEDADGVSTSSSWQCWSRSVCATHRQIHALHRAIDHILNELRLPRSALNTRLHDWRQQWELEQHSQVRRIVSTVSCEQPSLEEPTPEWFWPPYTITKSSLYLLGSGGFGQAYAGRWLDTLVVVKRVVILNECDRAQFQHEVNLWFQLNHPHVIQLFGACHVGDDPFFVCEHATNGRLDRYLERDEPKRVQTAWKKLCEAALGLLYLHAKGIVHADLKCDNIIVSGDDKAKVADFGLSLDVQSQSLHNCNQEALGAVQWRAPEVLRGEPSTFASDVFSFGMCVYLAVSGQIPWGPIPLAMVRAQVLLGNLLQQPAVFTDGQWELVQRMCRFEPRDRLRVADVVPILCQIVEWDGILDSLFTI